jgi:hypothetical protein
VRLDIITKQEWGHTTLIPRQSASASAPESTRHRAGFVCACLRLTAPLALHPIHFDPKKRNNLVFLRPVPSGGRSPGIVPAATPAWVVFDKSGALTAIKRAR